MSRTFEPFDESPPKEEETTSEISEVVTISGFKDVFPEWMSNLISSEVSSADEVKEGMLVVIPSPSHRRKYRGSLLDKEVVDLIDKIRFAGQSNKCKFWEFQKTDTEAQFKLFVKLPGTPSTMDSGVEGPVGSVVKDDSESNSSSYEDNPDFDTSIGG